MSDVLIRAESEVSIGRRVRKRALMEKTRSCLSYTMNTLRSINDNHVVRAIWYSGTLWPTIGVE